MPSLQLYAVNKYGNYPSGHIIDGKAYITRLRKRVVNHCLRIERIRIVLFEREGGRNLFRFA